MKLLKRILVLLTVLVLVLISAGIIALYFLPETGFIRLTLEQHLRETTGQEITIGDISVDHSLSKLFQVQLTGIEAKAVDGTKLLSAKRVLLAPELSALLRRHLTIKSVLVEGLWTTVERDQHGNIRGGFIPGPFSSSALSMSPSPTEAEQKPHETRRANDIPSRSAADRFTWSVESLQCVDCRLDFVDEKVVPGKRITVSVHGLSGTLSQASHQDLVQVDCSATVSLHETRVGTVRIKGPLTLTPDRSGVQKLSLAASTDAMDIAALQPYLSRDGIPFKAFGLGPTQLKVTWEAKKAAQVYLETIVRDDGQNATPVTGQGNVTFSETLPSISEITYQLTVKRAPSAFFVRFLPSSLHALPQTGTLEAAIQGVWKASANPTIEGTLTMDDFLPVKLEGVAKVLNLAFHVELAGDNLLVHSFKLSGPDTILSVTGQVTNLFSSERRSAELSCELPVQAAWLKEIGFRLPKDIAVGGRFLLTGTLKGNEQQIWLDLTADLTHTLLRWHPYVEKAAPSRATVTAKGPLTLPPLAETKQSKSKWDFAIKAHLDAAKVRFMQDGPWIEPASLGFEGRLLSGDSLINLRGGTLSIRRGVQGSELLTIRGDLRDLGHSLPKFDVTTGGSLDADSLKLLGIQLPEGVTFTGRAPVKGGFVGNPSQFTWTIDATLTETGITYQNVFRKPSGVAATLKASGERTGNIIGLSDAKLSLPGVLLAATGKIGFPKGDADAFTVEIKKADLKDVARFVPLLDDVRPTGLADAMVRLRNNRGAWAHQGKIQLLGAEFRPKNTPLTFSHVKGTAEIEDQKLHIPSLQGVMNGVVESPVQATASLAGLDSVQSIKGTISIICGKGKVKADRIRPILQSVQVLAGTILNPQSLDSQRDLLEIESLTGDFAVQSGQAFTENLRLRGNNLTVGTIGSFDLKRLFLDAVLAIHTVMVADGSLNQIPAVREFVKKHEGFLKGTGLDKAVEKLGIKVPKEGKETSDPVGPVKTPITVILELKGSPSAPTVTPILEAKLDPKKLAKLKNLLEQ